MDASSASSIQTDLQTWARSLGDGHERDVWEDGLRNLVSGQENADHILVFDNADDPNLNLVPFLAKSKHVTILITSRNHSLGNMSTTHHLELAEMEEDEALSTLMHAARRQHPLPAEENSDIRTLAAELGCLAVALSQAGTYCAELSSIIKGAFQPYTFTQYLSIFRAHRSSLMKKAETSALDNYQRGAYTAFDLSYHAVPPNPREFLHFISFFHHADIPLVALAIAAENKFEDMRSVSPRPQSQGIIRSALFTILCTDGKWNQLKLQETIRILRSFSLISTTSVNDALFLQLHPLVQAWSKDMEGLDPQYYEGMVLQVFSSCCGDNNYRIYQQILRHVIEKLPRLGSLHVNDQVAMGRILNQQGDSRNAVLAFETSLVTAKITREENGHSVRVLLADAYHRAGRWSEAEKLKLEVLQWDRELWGADHPNTIIATGNLASTYRSQGRFEEAEKLEADVLKRLRKILGAEHPHTLAAASNLSRTRRDLGRYKEAEELWVEVLEQRRRILGIEHPDTLLTAGNVVTAYYSSGRFEEAETLNAEVLEARRRVLGVEHPDTLTAALNLASIYSKRGRWEESEKLAVDVLEKRRRLLGVEHPRTIVAQNNLAYGYCDQGRWDDAVLLLESTVQSSLKVLGKTHPESQKRIVKLVQVYQRLGRREDAGTMSALLVSNLK